MEKCLLLYNPHSGKGKIAKNEMKICLRLSEKYDVEVCPSKYAGHIGEEITRRGEEFDLIVVCGGDGTLNECVHAVMGLDKKPKIGYIPTGTVNDVAHSLGISKNIDKAVKNILNGTPFKHDVMKINDKYGIYVCCAGIFTETSYATGQASKKKMGKVAYFFHGIKKLFTTPSISAKLITPENEVEGRYAIILILNSRSVASFKANKRAVLNDGNVDMVMIKNRGKKVGLGAIMRVARVFVFGIPKKSSKNIWRGNLSSFRLEMGEEDIINLDGERCGSGAFDFKVEKEGVEIIVPNSQKLTKYN